MAWSKSIGQKATGCGIRCLRGSRCVDGWDPRSWFGNRLLRPELVFGQRSEDIRAGRISLMWCGGWRKENENGGGTGMLCIDKYIRKVGTGLHSTPAVHQLLGALLRPGGVASAVQGMLIFIQTSLVDIWVQRNNTLSRVWLSHATGIIYLRPWLTHRRAQTCLPLAKVSDKSLEKVPPHPLPPATRRSQRPPRPTRSTLYQ